MTILSTIGDFITSWTRSTSTKKTVNEIFTFAAGFPYAQFMGAVLASGTNIPLDEAAAVAIFSDVMKAFFSGQPIEAATASVAAKVGIPAHVVAQIVYAPDPVHPSDPTQFSRGR